MNKNYFISTIIFMLIAFTYCCTIQSTIGCMEKSLYLREKYDPKVLHFVRCNCPCAQYIAQCTHPLPYNQCPMCKHLHIPQSQIIVTKAVRMAALKKEEHTTSPVAFENAEAALTYLFNNEHTQR